MSGQSQNWHPDFITHLVEPGEFVKVVPATFRGQARAFQLRKKCRKFVLASGGHDFLIRQTAFGRFADAFLGGYWIVQGRNIGPGEVMSSLCARSSSDETNDDR